jgi:inorganic pyrophosphatase
MLKILKILPLIYFFLIIKVYSEDILYKKNYKNLDGTYNAIIEIPAGDSIKYEVSKDGKNINEQIENSKVRIIDYLPYPFNYGFIPSTILPQNNGGDLLDIIVIGPRVDRGTILKVKPIGALVLLDKNKVDLKVIAVSLNETNLSSINNINELEKNFIGILDIIKLWIINYKGEILELKRVLKKKDTIEIIENYHKAFLKKN